MVPARWRALAPHGCRPAGQVLVVQPAGLGSCNALYRGHRVAISERYLRLGLLIAASAHEGKFKEAVKGRGNAEPTGPDDWQWQGTPTTATTATTTDATTYVYLLPPTATPWTLALQQSRETEFDKGAALSAARPLRFVFFGPSL